MEVVDILHIDEQLLADARMPVSVHGLILPPPPCDGCPFISHCRDARNACAAFIEYTLTRENERRPARHKPSRSREPSRLAYLELFPGDLRPDDLALIDSSGRRFSAELREGAEQLRQEAWN